MGLRVELVGSNDKLVSAASRYGLKPGSGPREAAYVVVLLGTSGAWERAAELLFNPESRGGLIVVLEGSRALGTGLGLALEAFRRGRRVSVIQLTSEGVVEGWMLDALRGLRAAASTADMTVLLYGFTEDEASESAFPDTRYYEPEDALETLKEALGYGGLYIGTYLAEYYPIEGLDEDLLSRSLGAYLALRSVLEASGSNAIVINCRLFDEENVDPKLAIHLLLDEGVPAACGSSEDLLRVQMLSLALSGKPPATGTLVDYTGGDLAVEPLIVPTLLSSERKLEPAPWGYVPANRLRPGDYTLLALGPGNSKVARVSARHVDDLILASGTAPWHLPSTLLSLAPPGLGPGIEWALYFLGLAPPSPPIPLG